MIVYVDEAGHDMIVSMDAPVHIRSDEDGYPLCWGYPGTGVGPYVGTYEMREATCEHCLDIRADSL